MKFGEKLFQTRLLSRFSHNVSRLLPSPVLLRKFTWARTAKPRAESCAGASTSVIIALAHRFSSNRETAGSLPSPQPSYDAKRPLRRKKEEADKGGGSVGENKVYYGKCTNQMAYNRGKSVDTRVCFPCTLAFFLRWEVQSRYFFWVGFEKTSYATSRQLSRSLLLNFFT